MHVIIHEIENIITFIPAYRRYGDVYESADPEIRDPKSVSVRQDIIEVHRVFIHQHYDPVFLSHFQMVSEAQDPAIESVVLFRSLSVHTAKIELINAQDYCDDKCR